MDCPNPTLTKGETCSLLGTNNIYLSLQWSFLYNVKLLIKLYKTGLKGNSPEIPGVPPIYTQDKFAHR